ncbi:right-handed parallel beta-helix repeat-containing protein [Herbiconiux sp. A18JL235]|uniref:Right-handed parallel beta-helix repeat-containing protein n=1 Tax=Herbiconiux sp. A18JL235 TaxID=3152363 RepID=A0AB39BEB7_9MICO
MSTVSCSNSGPGTSPSAPWCDFTNVNSATLVAGDEIRLARGSTWNQELRIDDSGTAAAPIVVDAYGSGARPAIVRSGANSDRGVYLENVSNVTVRNLEISHAAVGVQAYYSTLNHSGLTISDIYAHHITGIAQGNNPVYDGTCSQSPIPGLYTSAGVAITGPATKNGSVTTFPFTSSQTALTGLVVTRVEVTASNMGVMVGWCNGVRSTDGTDGTSLITNAVFDSLNLHDLDGGGDVRADCPNAITLMNMQNSTLRNSVIDRAGACHSRDGTAGIVLMRMKDVVVANNIVANVPNVGSAADQMGIDLEYATSNVSIFNNAITGNYGAGISSLAIRSAACGSSDTFDHSDWNTISSNLIQGNGANGDGGIRRVSNCFTPTGTINNNLYQQSQLLVSGPGEDFRGYIFSNNRDVAGNASAWYAARDFSSSANAWSYASKSGSGGWTSLPYSASAGSYTSGTAFVSAFLANPSSTLAVSRAWTAPATGTISMRSRALLVGGSAAVVRVTVNGNQAYPAQTVQPSATGVELNLDALAVTAGDVVRFEVDAAAGAQVSWVPAIGYDAGTPILDQSNEFGAFQSYRDIRGTVQRMQSFVPLAADTRAAIWAYKNGSPAGDLVVKVYQLNSSGQPTVTVATRTIGAASVSTSATRFDVTFGALTAGQSYGIAISSPGSTGNGTSNSYGFAYSEDSRYANGRASFSGDSGASWALDPAARDLRFASYR